jgi:hypothetical protein
MAGFGNALLKSIKERLDHAQTVNDNAAPALAPSYLKFKQSRGGSEIRDLRLTGRTRRGMQLLEAGQNYAVIGFSDPVALERVRFNNAKSRQWGVSPANERDLQKVIGMELLSPVQAEQVA